MLIRVYHSSAQLERVSAPVWARQNSSPNQPVFRATQQMVTPIMEVSAVLLATMATAQTTRAVRLNSRLMFLPHLPSFPQPARQAPVQAA
jgi:hypothetical protein